MVIFLILNFPHFLEKSKFLLKKKTYFSECGDTPVEEELLTISVNLVVIASEIISELILRMLNGSFAQMVLFTVCTIQRISTLFISAKTKTENRK